MPSATQREEAFLTALGAGLTLVIVGTLSYALGEGWNVVDALYFAVATLTTTSVADPDVVLNEGWMKVFTVFYLLIGIGVLVEILRRLGSRSSWFRPRSEPRRRRRRPADRSGGVARQDRRLRSRYGVSRRYIRSSPTYPCSGWRKASGIVASVSKPSAV